MAGLVLHNSLLVIQFSLKMMSLVDEVPGSDEMQQNILTDGMIYSAAVYSNFD